MPRLTRPTVKSPCVADTHHGPHERIVEVYWPSLREAWPPPHGEGNEKATAAGCLLSFNRADDGTPTLDVYQVDPTVRVRAPLGNLQVTAMVTEAMVDAAFAAFTEAIESMKYHTGRAPRLQRVAIKAALIAAAGGWTHPGAVKEVK